MDFDFENSVEFDLHNSSYGKLIIERYDLNEQIYQSSLSHIFIIKDKFTEQLFTLKIIKKKLEIQLYLKDIKSILHPRIAPVVNHGESERYIYIVKPYAKGLTLKQYILSHGVLSDTQIQHLMVDLLSIFQYLHQHDEAIIYRDLKPDNLIFNRGNHFTLIDTVTCRTLKSNQSTDTFYVGTPGYASPEQYGYGQSDVRSDIYTLGATLYFALTATAPKANDLKEIHNTLLKSNASKRITTIILKCLQFDPNKRYQTIDTLTYAYQKPALIERFKDQFRKKRYTIPEPLIQQPPVPQTDSFHQVNIQTLKSFDDEVKVKRENDFLIFFVDHVNVAYVTVQINYSEVYEETLKKAIYDAGTRHLTPYDAKRGYLKVIEDNISNYLVLAFDKNYNCLGYQRILASKLCDAGLIHFENKYIRDIPLDHGIIVSTFRDELYLHISKDIMKEHLRDFQYVVIKSYNKSITEVDIIKLHQLIKEEPNYLRLYAEDGNRSGPMPGYTCKEIDWAFMLLDANEQVLATYQINYIN